MKLDAHPPGVQAGSSDGTQSHTTHAHACRDSDTTTERPIEDVVAPEFATLANPALGGMHGACVHLQRPGLRRHERDCQIRRELVAVGGANSLLHDVGAALSVCSDAGESGSVGVGDLGFG